MAIFNMKKEAVLTKTEAKSKALKAKKSLLKDIQTQEERKFRCSLTSRGSKLVLNITVPLITESTMRRTEDNSLRFIVDIKVYLVPDYDALDVANKKRII
uniref:Uncharacterized protein n=1 Tax=Salvator merianae TaxID=96440 RepID=A0A8D0BGZ1_SALMN